MRELILRTWLLFITFSVQKSKAVLIYLVKTQEERFCIFHFHLFIHFVPFHHQFPHKCSENHGTCLARILASLKFSYKLTTLYCGLCCDEMENREKMHRREMRNTLTKPEFSAGRIKTNSGLCDYENGDDENEGMTWKLNVKPKSWLLPKSKLTKLPRYSSSQ